MSVLHVSQTLKMRWWTVLTDVKVASRLRAGSNGGDFLQSILGRSICSTDFYLMLFYNDQCDPGVR